jgi:thiol-disulfide isomerase/thioredoxin
MSDTHPEEPSNSRRTWILIAAVFAAFWVAYLGSFAPKRRALLEDTALVDPAEYEWSAVDLNDRPVPFTKFKGKTVFLNIWATWCGPCVSEMPSIDRLSRIMKDRQKSIEFVCVSTDTDTPTVRAFVQDRGWNMTILRADRLPEVFTTEGIPVTFVIAPDGRIAASELGAAKWDDPKVVQFLDGVAGLAVDPAKN